jgi:hypothetical protein
VSDDIAKAARDAVEAADNSQQLALIVAALQAQQIVKAVQPQPCQHQAPKQEFNATKWLVIGGTAATVGIALAVSAVAVAISAVALTFCLLIVRSVWNDVRKTPKE